MNNFSLEDPTRTASRKEIWYESDGVRLYAVDTGEGSPVVFAHGGLADHRAALFRVGFLAAQCRLVLPDLRGAGRSVCATGLSWDRLADDVIVLLDHLGIERAVVGGTSMGSGVALRFALRHPERLRGVVLLSPLYAGFDRGLAPAAVAAMQIMAGAGERCLEHGVEALLPLFERLPSPVREVAVEMALGFDAASVAETTRFLATSVQPLDSANELAAVDAPALIVPGTDPEHPADVAHLYARHLRRAELVDPTSPGASERIAAFCRLTT